MKKAMLLTWGMYKRKEFHLGTLHDIYGTIVSAGSGGIGGKTKWLILETDETDESPHLRK